MIKIVCPNPICGETFYFNEEKFPNATKVKCPKCGLVSPRSSLGASPPPVPPSNDDDWFKPTPKVVERPPDNFLPQPDLPTPSNQEYEDFSAPPPQPKPKPEPPIIRQPEFRPPTPVQPNRSPVPDAIGWLVIHDEFTEARTFSLRKGLNSIGRASDTTPLEVNIRIETRDSYMSRRHCDVEVRQKPGGGYDYFLSDRDYGGKKASANGTFVNGRKRMAPMDEYLLRDGDTIQVGRTKLVLKLPSAVQDAQDAQDRVRQTDFFHTIIE